MKFQILFWISLSFLLVWIGIYAASASKLLAAFPKIVRPGSPLIVNCHLLKRGSQNLILELVKDGSTIRQNTSTVTFGKQHNIMLNVPPDLTSSKNLRVKLSYSGDSIVSPIQYDDLKSVVLMQTDRGMYAKNEEVKMRIVTLTQSLKPLKTQISVAIYDGKNKLVQQWLNVRGVLGVFSRKFSIPGDPNNGQWRIVVDDTKRKTEKTFIVRKYVVPKYKVDISCPTFFTRSTRRLRCLVKARYMFGRKVNGVVHAQLVTKTRDGDKFLYNHHDNIRGEFWITTTKNTSFIFENDIEVIARVSDPSTGTTVVNSAVINLRRDAKMIWSLEPIRKHFQPGLKFVTFLKFQNLKSYRMLVSIKLTKKALKTCFGVYKYVDISSEMKTKYVYVDSHGFGKLTLNIDNDVTELKFMTHHQSDKHEETLSQATRPGLGILPEHYLGTVGSSLKFQIITKSSVKGPIWYSITSRGSEISGGKCSDGSRFRSRFTCSLMVEPNFYPTFELLFYYVKSDGVVMSDSVHIKVRGNPTKKFFSISKDKGGTYIPGEKIRFTLRSHRPSRNSVVHIMAIDEAIQKSQSGFDITMHDIQSFLNGMFSGTQKYETVNLEGGKKTKKSDFSKYPKTCKDPCTSSPCQNRGKCEMRSYNDFKCKCNKFYSGNLCEKYKSPLNSWSGNGFFVNIPPSYLKTSFIKEACADCGNGIQLHSLRPGPKVNLRLQRPKVIPGRGSLPLKKITGNLLNRMSNTTSKRLYFPKTWIWEDVNMRGRSSVTLTKKLPGTMTTWVTSVFGVNDDDGFGILNENDSLKIPVFLLFFIELKTPSYVVAGNSAVVKITLFNNSPATKMVYVHIQFQSETSGFSRQLASGNSTVYFHGIQPKAGRYGAFNVTVVAYDLMNSFQVLDWIQKPINVKAPGLQQMYNIPYFLTMSNRMSSVIKTVRITLPHHAIQGTQSVYLTVTGDIMAPTIGGLGHLIRTPCGCGEQTMMYLAPNVYVIHYLKSSNQLSADVRTKIVTNINRGIDNELRWQKSDGSFSVWGNRDPHGSTWLTSFVLLCFHQADSFVPVDRDIFTRGLNWLLKKQNVDGSFQEDGYVIHYQMQGGVVASRATITAYVLLTLLENKDIREYKTKMAIAKKKAVQYLTRSSVIRDLRNTNHGMAFTSYVLQKAGSQGKARQLYATLKAMSKKSGDYMFWQDSGSKVYKQKLRWQAPNPRARPIDIETSAYALLYLSERRDITEGMKIMKWLVSQRNPQGGFTSTQDTVVSLHALSRFSSMLRQSNLNAQVKVKSGSTEKTFYITQKNKQLIQRMELGNSTSNVEIKTSGKGLVLIDTVVKYNVMKSEDAAFEITTSISSSKQTFDKITVNVCIRRKDNKDYGMVVAEIGVPCGFVGDLTKTRARGLEHKETSSDAVVLYFKNLRGSKVCFDVTANRVDKVTESQAIPITVYDYYEPVNHGISSYRSGKLKEMNLCSICKHCTICQGIELG